jgi:predicted GTPase
MATRVARDSAAGLRRFRELFADQPELLDVMTMSTLQDKELQHLFQACDLDLFRGPVNVYVTGRTVGGKTTLVNTVAGLDLSSTGEIDCTEKICRVVLPSKLNMFDTPGNSGRDDLENRTRKALGLKLLVESKKTLPVPLVVRELGADGLERNGIKARNQPKETETLVPIEQWKKRSELLPDVVLYVISARDFVLREEKVFLADLLEVHGGRVIVALNLWDKESGWDSSPVRIEQARASVRSAVLMSGAPEPPVVEINVKTGKGLTELTYDLCSVIATDKLGTISSLLNVGLTHSAREKRTKRYLETLIRVGARLACRKSNEKEGINKGLIQLAFETVIIYAGLTFELDVGEPDQQLVDWVKAEARKVKVKKRLPKAVQVERANVPNREVKVRVPKTTTTTVKTGWLKHAVATVFGVASKVVTAPGEGIQYLLSVHERDRIWSKIEDCADTLRYTTVTKTVEEWKSVALPAEELATFVKEKPDHRVKREVQTARKFGSATRGESLPGGYVVLEALLALGIGAMRLAREHGKGQRLVDHAEVARCIIREKIASKGIRKEIERLIAKGRASESELIHLLDQQAW